MFRNQVSRSSVAIIKKLSQSNSPQLIPENKLGKDPCRLLNDEDKILAPNEFSEINLLSLRNYRDQIIEQLVLRLTAICRKNQELPRQYTPFDSFEIPLISIESYLKRIIMYSSFGPDNTMNSVEMILIGAWMILERFIKKTTYLLDFYNIHKLLITSALLFVKVEDDFYFNNLRHARIGGVSLEEMNFLERELLIALDYHVFFNTEEQSNYLKQFLLENPRSALGHHLNELSQESKIFSSPLKNFTSAHRVVFPNGVHQASYRSDIINYKEFKRYGRASFLSPRVRYGVKDPREPKKANPKKLM